VPSRLPRRKSENIADRTCTGGAPKQKFGAIQQIPHAAPGDQQTSPQSLTGLR
jgi:hypothetical protein